MVQKQTQPPFRILLAEDSAAIRAFTQTYFKDTSHHLDIAENGHIALEKFKAGRPGLVFMDVEMPVMDGCTATREIRKWEQESGLTPVPIIALTSHDVKEKIQEILKAGFTAHLTKPLTKGSMLKAIEDHKRR